MLTCDWLQLSWTRPMRIMLQMQRRETRVVTRRAETEGEQLRYVASAHPSIDLSDCKSFWLWAWAATPNRVARAASSSRAECTAAESSA